MPGGDKSCEKKSNTVIYRLGRHLPRMIMASLIKWQLRDMMEVKEGAIWKYLLFHVFIICQTIVWHVLSYLHIQCSFCLTCLSYLSLSDNCLAVVAFLSLKSQFKCDLLCETLPLWEVSSTSSSVIQWVAIWISMSLPYMALAIQLIEW